MKLKFNIKRIIVWTKKLLFFLAENVFLSCLILFLLSLIIGGIMLFKTTLFLKTENYDDTAPLKLEEDGHENILKSWEKENKKFEQSEDKIRRDVFYPKD